MKYTELIAERRSVRTFDGKGLSEKEVSEIMKCAAGADNPFDIGIEWRILDAVKDGLSSPVIDGTDVYIAGKMKRIPYAEEAFGYSFEKIVLYAQSIGIGTTWIAGTMDRKAFERAMDIRDDEVLPAVSPLGHPAMKMSFREKMMRKGVGAEKRLPFSEICFRDSFDRPLDYEDAGILQQPLEAVRLAPSAVNRQPWRIVVSDDKVRFYKKASKGMTSPSWDIQKIDMGIALCHFEVVAMYCGLSVRSHFEDPDIVGDESPEYIVTCIIDTNDR